jgi:hypothetical protein
MCIAFSCHIPLSSITPILFQLLPYGRIASPSKCEMWFRYLFPVKFVTGLYTRCFQYTLPLSLTSLCCRILLTNLMIAKLVMDFLAFNELTICYTFASIFSHINSFFSLTPFLLNQFNIIHEGVHLLSTQSLLVPFFDSNILHQFLMFLHNKNYFYVSEKCGLIYVKSTIIL